ncbi:maleylpyruvate isomerase family mycothiol-dependent enzyme [Nocardia carnea]|uniref:maleylpyruvate isomerase family mycothiol-dependent enzyme n=1 Tax=Nocardia carnea TaxID=37328 RepID=UPI002453B038|nr:maleylpyruvate isomerase family mycothiol-dependent enzyme [Nocardia carnea]
MRTPVNVMDMARAEREDIAALLATLTPPQWEAPSLCAGWRVRDVVAHMVSYDHLDARGLAARFVKGRIVHANEVGVDEFRALHVDELLEFFRRHRQPRGLTAGFGGMIALVDGLIHHQDIRRPLGLPRVVPPDRLHYVLTRTPGNPRLGAGRRIRGLRLSATDLDWSHGRGAEVHGPAEALLLAMAGRRGITGELTGPGVPLLAARIGDRPAQPPPG